MFFGSCVYYLHCGPAVVRYILTMATLPRLTEEEYLHTSFPDLDREFRDGEVVGRALPDWFHSRSQSKFDRFFGNREDTLNIQVGAELRVRLRPGRHVIPDVAVFWPAEPEGSVPDRLPLIAIEILSEPERMSKVPDKLDEYAKWGVSAYLAGSATEDILRVQRRTDGSESLHCCRTEPHRDSGRNLRLIAGP
jgi:Uma2 family endonuclease